MNTLSRRKVLVVSGVVVDSEAQPGRECLY